LYYYYQLTTNYKNFQQTMTQITPTTNEILDAVSAIQDEAISFLSRIVSVDSTLDKGEGDVQAIIYEHLKDVLGDDFQVERIPVEIENIQHKVGFSPVDWEYDEGKFNVLACSPSNNKTAAVTEKRSLILQGHVDVVPASKDKWTSSPFTPHITDGRMYGRGAGDMKAGVVAMIYALVVLKRLGYVPLGNVRVCTVIEEECTGNGALACLSKLISTNDGDSKTKTAVIIPEPFPFITTAQLGVLWFTAKVSGKPCHVLQTSAGSNAIEGAFTLFSALKPLEEKWNDFEFRKSIPGAAAYKDMEHPINFNLGRIEGGNWASSVPSSCWFEARVGFFPGVDIEDVKRDVESILNKEAEKIGVGLEISYRGFHAQGAVLLPEYVDGAKKNETKSEDDKSLQKRFVKLLQQCHSLASTISCNNEDSESSNHATKELSLLPITCTTDARFYSSIHQNPEEVVVTCYGPEATNIHGVDESVSLESMRQVTVAIALFVRDWCGLVKSS
jgi:acetylornithine deacetylase